MKKVFILFPILAALACNAISVPLVKGSRPTPTKAAATPVTSGGEVQPPVLLAPESEYGRLARFHLEALAEIGPRVPGTGKEKQAEQYIVNTFKTLGYAPETYSFSAWDENEEEFQSSNVIAVKPGESEQEIIIGAHYDSGDEGQGVDDNASGVAVLLEVAGRIAGVQTPYTIRFIAFGSEENDLDGSYSYAYRMKAQEIKNTIAMVNLDSLVAGDITYVYSDEGDQSFLRDWVLDWAGKNGIPLQTVYDADLTDWDEPVSDYGAFQERGMAFAYFEATNWNLGDKDGWTQVDPQYGDEGYIWHTRYDNLVYLEDTFPGRIDDHLNIFVSAICAICTSFSFE